MLREHFNNHLTLSCDLDLLGNGCSEVERLNLPLLVTGYPLLLRTMLAINQIGPVPSQQQYLYPWSNSLVSAILIQSHYGPS